MHVPANQVLPIRYMNNADATTIYRGQPVYVFSSNRNVKIARVTSFAEAQYWGTAIADVAQPDHGFFAYAGPVIIPSSYQYGSSWAAGDYIYLNYSSAGSYRNAPHQIGGYFIVPIGRVAEMIGSDAIVTIEKGEIVEVPGAPPP